MKLRKVNQFPHDIMFGDADPCISIYMPTHRRTTNWKQDKIRLKNLVSDVEHILLEDMKKVEVDKLLKPLNEILDDNYFWNTVKDSLVILLNNQDAIYYIMNRDVEEFILVSDEFYLKPLIRNFQSYDKYHVLGLSQDEFKLFEGTRYSFSEIKLEEDVATNRSDLIDESDKAMERSFRGNVRSAGRTTGAIKSFHGHSSKDEEIKKGTMQFFRYVDEFVDENYTSIEDTPLILITLPENQGEFRAISKNKNLLEKGINKSLTSIDEKEVAEEIWDIIEPIYLDKTKTLIDRFRAAQAESLASIDLLEIAHGCSDGRVDTLIIQSNKNINKYYNVETRKLENVDDIDINKVDLINQLAILTFAQKGEVIVLPEERFPEPSGCIAIFRY